LKYPTGEKISIEFLVKAKIEIGSYSVEIFLFIAEINDQCILGIDFLKMINLDKVFKNIMYMEFAEEEIKEREKNQKNFVDIVQSSANPAQPQPFTLRKQSRA